MSDEPVFPTAKGKGVVPGDGRVTPKVRVYAAGAAKEVVMRVAPEFTRTTGIRVDPVYNTVGALRDRLLEGETCDVALLSSAALDTLAGANLLAVGSRWELGFVAIALAVKKGRPFPTFPPLKH